jgi:hypothetical protein
MANSKTHNILFMIRLRYETHQHGKAIFHAESYHIGGCLKQLLEIHSIASVMMLAEKADAWHSGLQPESIETLTDMTIGDIIILQNVLTRPSRTNSQLTSKVL